ncbi:MAG: site-specific integrase [Syntrophobacteraceae bacterium]
MTKITLPAHLIQNRYGFCFRIIVPLDLRRIVGRRELRYSLKTGNVREAKNRSVLVAASIKQYFEEIRDGMEQKIPVSEKVKAFFEKRQPYKTDKQILVEIRDGIVQLNDKYVGGSVIIENPPVSAQPPIKEPSIRLSALIKKYVEWQLAEKNWCDNSEIDIVPYLNWFLDYIGDDHIDRITTDDAGEFKKTLRRLPPNHRKILQYKKLSMRDIARLDHEHTLGASTIQNTLNKVGAMFNYAVGMCGLASNPFTSYVKGKKPKKAKRDEFTIEELNKIFHAKQYINDSFEDAFDFWLPIIGAFTGARLNELCQLHTDDIREHDGILCLSINDEFEKRTKNEQSKREVPMHSFLLKIGFHRYVNDMKEAGHTLVFYTLKLTNKGYIHKPSNHFGTFLDSIGIPERSKVFHSWRYTVINHLARKGMLTTDIADIVGHERGSTSGIVNPEPVANMTAKYLLPGYLKDVKKKVEKIEYAGLDLSHLLKSKYARRERKRSLTSASMEKWI